MSTAKTTKGAKAATPRPPTTRLASDDADVGKYLVLEGSRVLYQADSIDEGLAFIQGYEGGVLARLLTGKSKDVWSLQSEEREARNATLRSKAKAKAKPAAARR